MNRIMLIQYLIDKNGYSTYLEIGSQRGESLLPIKCRKKIAVDPCFLLKNKDKLKACFQNYTNFNNKYFEMTSDDFFLNRKSFLNNLGKLEIVFIDGLHTFSASLKDALNSLEYLDDNGTIVMHDCFPPHKAAATKGDNAAEVISRKHTIKGWTGEWCGDTWKTIVYLKHKYSSQLDIQVLNNDYGIGIIKYKIDTILDLNIDYDLVNKIDKLNYEDLINKPQEMISLVDEIKYENY
ncbi:class I SAM-dependent methyltransferase [Salegentibacter mishustinae]|nr:class I SAM-dependent methyltransferase [Salegentibacter mishustinae]